MMGEQGLAGDREERLGHLEGERPEAGAAGRAADEDDGLDGAGHGSDGARRSKTQPAATLARLPAAAEGERRGRNAEERCPPCCLSGPDDNRRISCVGGPTMNDVIHSWPRPEGGCPIGGAGQHRFVWPRCLLGKGSGR